MLTDEELIDTIIRAPTGWNSRTTLLGLGRAVEAAVLEKQGRLLREAQMLAAPHFTAAPIAAGGINGGNSESECVREPIAGFKDWAAANYPLAPGWNTATDLLLRRAWMDARAFGAKEIDLATIRFWPDGMQERLEHVWRDLVGFIPNYKLYDLQRALAEFGFTLKVYERPVATESAK